MKIFIEREKKEENIKLDKPIIIKDLLKEKKISIESVILVKNNKVVLENELLKDNDELKILSVVSGG